MAVWKDIPGYVGLYQASDDGRVRRPLSYVPPKRGRVTWPGKELSPATTQDGYLFVVLCDNNTGGIDFSGTTSKQILVPSAFPADTMATLTAVLGQALQLDQVGAGEWNDGDGALNITTVYDLIRVL